MSSNLADKPTLANIPPFETAWWKTDSYMFPYHQWEPIWNGQLIRKYKKIPVQWQINRYIETNTQLDTIGRWTPQSSKQRCLPYHYTNYWIYCTYRYQRQMDPPGKLPECRVNSLLYNVINESPFETVNLSENIRKYQCNGRLRHI